MFTELAEESVRFYFHNSALFGWAVAATSGLLDDFEFHRGQTAVNHLQLIGGRLR